MGIFIVSDIANREMVLNNIKEHYDGNFYDSGRGAVFIAAAGETSKDVAVKIGISQECPMFTTGIVVLMGDYWGHHDGTLWQWLRAKGAQGS